MIEESVSDSDTIATGALSSSSDKEAIGEPVELLVQLAEDGEIEPWDIDIVAVTDAYLDKLDNVDLRVSGRALFYASVLLRMKSDILVEPLEEEPEQGEEPLHMDGPLPMDDDPIAELEEEMDRRLGRKRARGKPETLDELVRELRDIERRSWWKSQREYDTSESPRGFHRGTQTIDYHAGDDSRRDGEPTAADVTKTAHAEDIEDVIELVLATITEQFDTGRREVLFAEIEDAGGSRVQTFLAVLFLSHRGQVTLEQDECFADLWIMDPNATPREDPEAIPTPTPE